MPVEIKRAYDKPSLSDGQRVLVDRLWPRGVKKEGSRIDHWLKNLAPSEGLRKWFHSSANWIIFKKRYFKELSTPEASADLQTLYGLLNDHERVTLIYASKDVERNNAAALKELAPSEGLRKWFHSSANWIIFKKRYFKELSTPEASAELENLYRLLNEHEHVTLIYASKDVERNNAAALKELLEGMKKPPSSSGPARAMAVPRRMAKRRSS